MQHPTNSGLVLVLALLTAAPTGATEWFVSAGASGTGTADAPFGRIQDGIDAARPGDTVIVEAGTYHERLRTVRAGLAGQRITVRASGAHRSVLVTASGRVLTVSHPQITIEGLVLDGQYGLDDIVRVGSQARGFTMRYGEVRRTSRDAIDMGAVEDVLIEESVIHHALNAAGGRRDAHGIVAGGVRRLVIRNTEVHTFSGDAFQVDPRRSQAGWDDVLIEGCRFWLKPLPAAENGFAAGTVPGENAIDTKASGAAPRAKLTIRNTEASGFRNGLISNMAAFNLKEHIDAVIDGVTVFDSEIAFRLRGHRTTSGARVRIQNAVVHSSAVAFRYENNIETPRIYNVTLGSGVARPFVSASSRRTTLDVRNLLLAGSKLPPQARRPSNRAVPLSAFVDAAGHDYRLSEGSPAIDSGEPIATVSHDRDGTSRPQGRRHDIGAYEQAGRPGG